MEQFYLGLFVLVYAMSAIFVMAFSIVTVTKYPAQPWIMALFVISSGIFWWVYLFWVVIDRNKARDKHG